jgi:hypothetical protein
MTFRPLISTNSTPQNYGQINDMVRSLNNEQQVKVFKGTSGKPALTNGRYMDGRYGTVISDLDGTYRRILVGQHPTDGRPGIWISKDGIDVIDELSA